MQFIYSSFIKAERITGTWNQLWQTRDIVCPYPKDVFSKKDGQTDDPVIPGKMENRMLDADGLPDAAKPAVPANADRYYHVDDAGTYRHFHGRLSLKK